MGRTGHPALILGTSALVVAAVGTGVALTRDSVPVARAATTLAAVHHVTLVSPTGLAHAAHDGERVPSGFVVRTATAGSAELLTRGRITYVEGSTAVAVINGAHQQLRTGGAVVDAQQGPGLQLDLAGAELSVPDGSATEALRSVSVTVGSLAGPSQITNPSARRLTVPALAQAVINGDALPAATTPLHLSDSAAESHAVPTLVDDDNRLRVLARGIDSSGVTTAHTIDASWGGPTTTLPPRALPSESALPIVIADATSGGTLQDRYRHVVQWRRAGGSWGVALELLRGHAGSVESKLLALQHSLPAGQIGHITSVAALTAPHAPGGGGPQPRPTTGPTGTPTSPPPTTGPGGHGGGPKPTPSQGPVGKVAGTVGGVVKTVIGLLPVKKVLHRLPVPSKSSGGLGGLLRSGH